MLFKECNHPNRHLIKACRKKNNKDKKKGGKGEQKEEKSRKVEEDKDNDTDDSTGGQGNLLGYNVFIFPKAGKCK